MIPYQSIDLPQTFLQAHPARIANISITESDSGILYMGWLYDFDANIWTMSDFTYGLAIVSPDTLTALAQPTIPATLTILVARFYTSNALSLTGQVSDGVNRAIYQLDNFNLDTNPLYYEAPPIVPPSSNKAYRWPRRRPTPATR